MKDTCMFTKMIIKILSTLLYQNGPEICSDVPHKVSYYYHCIHNTLTVHLRASRSAVLSAYGQCGGQIQSTWVCNDFNLIKLQGSDRVCHDWRNFSLKFRPLEEMVVGHTIDLHSPRWNITLVLKLIFKNSAKWPILGDNDVMIMTRV